MTVDYAEMRSECEEMGPVFDAMADGCEEMKGECEEMRISFRAMRHRAEAITGECESLTTQREAAHN